MKYSKWRRRMGLWDSRGGTRPSFAVALWVEVTGFLRLLECLGNGYQIPDPGLLLDSHGATTTAVLNIVVCSDYVREGARL